MTRVLLVDDHPVVREGIAAVLATDPNVEVVGYAGDAQEAFDAVKRLEPDVVVIDVRLPDMDGIDACEKLRIDWPDLRVMVVTRFANERVMMRAFDAGALAYLVKESEPLILRQALRIVANGGTFVDPRLADKLVASATRGRRTKGPYGLTSQEMRVVGLLPRGFSNREIAGELGVSVDTVKTHLSSAMRKLGVHDRAVVAALAVEKGLV